MTVSPHIVFQAVTPLKANSATQSTATTAAVAGKAFVMTPCGMNTMRVTFTMKEMIGT